MKKLLTILSVLAIGMYAQATDDINTYNLKENNMYLLDLGFKADKIEITDNDILSITPITSLSDDGKQLIIEALKNGVCDVIITEKNQSRKFRFITGKIFQDNDNNLIEIDIPPTIN